MLRISSVQGAGREGGLMGEPHCQLCAMAGYRTCDACAAIIFDPVDGLDGEELCDECAELLPGAEVPGG